MKNHNKGYIPYNFSTLALVLGVLIVFLPTGSSAAPLAQGNDWFVAAPQTEIIGLARYYENFIFPPSIGNEHTISDTYRIFPFYLDKPATISVEVKATSGNKMNTVISPQKLGKGSHYFVITHGDIDAIGVEKQFSIHIKGHPIGADKPSMTLARFPGLLTHYIRGNILGQIIQHDVMINRGQLSLSRDDLELKGRGPSFLFSRSYNNQSPYNIPYSTLGPGWNHSHSISLAAVAYGTKTTPFNLPEWVQEQKLSFHDLAQLNTSDGPYQVVYLSNGGPFKKINARWVPQMGHHGRLIDDENGFVFISKDGTRYLFDAPKRPPIPDPKRWFGRNNDKCTISPVRLYGGASQTFVQEIEDSNGNKITYHYEDTYHGPLLTNLIDAVNRELQFNYQQLETGPFFTETPHRLVKVTGPDNIVLEFTYDKNGYNTGFRRDDLAEKYEYQQEHPTLQSEITTYNLNKTIDGNNHTTTFGYLSADNVPDYFTKNYPGVDVHDVVNTITYPDGTVAKIEFDTSDSSKRKIFDLKGNPTLYTFNSSGNPTQTIDPMGNKVQRTWGPEAGIADLVLVNWREKNMTTSYKYDKQGNMTEETQSDGHLVKSTWNQLFSVLQERVWPNGSRYFAEYDKHGNKVKELTADGIQTIYKYNQFGELIESKQADGETTQYAYDQWGLLQLTSNSQGTEKYQNDIRGRILKVEKADGTTTQLKYDNLDRLTWSKTGDVITTNKYDIEGNLIFESDGKLKIWYTYDELERVATAVANNGKEEKYTYDANSNLLVTERKNGVTRRQQYDAADNEIIPPIARKQAGHPYHRGR